MPTNVPTTTTHEDDSTLTGGRHLDQEVYRRGSSAPDPSRHRTSQPPLEIEAPPPRSKPRYGRGSDGSRNNAARRNGRCRSN